MTFTKKQQELLVLMLNKKGHRLQPNGQRIYKSRNFYDMVKQLKGCGLVRSFKRESDGSSYQLTDKGIVFSSIINDKIEKEDVFDFFDFVKWAITKE